MMPFCRKKDGFCEAKHMKYFFFFEKIENQSIQVIMLQYPAWKFDM